MKLRNYFLILVVGLGISACNLDYFQDPEFGEFVWDPSLAIPLGELNYTVSELFEELDDGTATIGPEEGGLVTIAYEETIAAQSASEFLEILDQTFFETVNTNTDIVSSPEEQVIGVSEVYAFDLSSQGDEEIDSVYFSAGDLNVIVNSNIPYPTNYSIVITSLRENGSTRVIDGSISSSNVSQDRTSLEGVVGLFHLDDLANITSNTFLLEVNYELIVPVGGSLSASDNLAVEFQLRNAEYSDLFGFVGNQSLDFQAETVEFGLFDVFSSGEISFANPKVEFIFMNQFGFPVGIDYSNITATANTGAIIPLTGSINDELAVVNAPTIDGTEDIVETIHIIDVTNSNISEIFSSQPSSFSIEVGASPNPSNGPTQYNFINALQTVEGRALIEVPLDVGINELIANEAFDFQNADDLEQAKRALMRVISTNEMPMGGDLEIQFLDENGGIIYTIDERPVFEGAEIGPDGKTVGAAETTSEVLLEDADLRQIERAVRVNIRARLSTTDIEQNTAVKFFEDYTLNLKVALQADVELTSGGEDD